MTKCDQKTSGDNFFLNFMRIREGLVKSVYAQETDWKDQGEIMWKQIVKDGGLEEIKRQCNGTRDADTI